MLSGADKGKLRDLIIEIFSEQEFEEFLAERLEKNLEHLAATRFGFSARVWKVIDVAGRQIWYPELIIALTEERPRYSNLIEFAKRLGLYDSSLGNSFYHQIPDKKLNLSGLEALVNGTPMLPIMPLINGILRTKRCVCRIEAPASNGTKTQWGTGFLVGKNLVLSNYHVFEDVIKDQRLANKVIFKFDYEVTDTGQIINSGIDKSLDTTEPIVAYSKYCDLDLNGSDSLADLNWPNESLDYALVRLNESVGENPFGTNVNRVTPSDENKRGWLCYNSSSELQIGGHLIIVQHPNREPIKIAFGFNSVIGLDKDLLRVRYAVNTLGGSSGSPCFDKDFNWVALHNMGDPNFNPKYNQGIPAKAIIEDLINKGIELS